LTLSARIWTRLERKVRLTINNELKMEPFSERHELGLLTTPDALFGGFETQNVVLLMMLKVSSNYKIFVLCSSDKSENFNKDTSTWD